MDPGSGLLDHLKEVKEWCKAHNIDAQYLRSFVVANEDWRTDGSQLFPVRVWKVLDPAQRTFFLLKWTR